MQFDLTKTSSGESMTPERAAKLLKLVLAKRFPLENERQVVLPKGDRFNFCCPFCGDSTDPRKKRGNLYIGPYVFKCYNGGCERFTNFTRMLKEFEFDHLLTDAEKVGLKLAADEDAKTSTHSKARVQQDIRMSALISSDLKALLVPRRMLAEKLKLLEIKNDSPTGVYLKKRCQPLSDRFMWDPIGKRLFIFNVDESGDFVFAAQSRQFGNATSKYLTYDITYLWSKFMGSTDVDLLGKCQALDKVSTLFGVLTVDLSLPVTAFEGPMDSFLFPNSVATCSINNELPFQIDTIRWFQDNDVAGHKKAMQRVQVGSSVFMWKKFLRDRNIATQKIKDFNDLVIYQVANQVDLGLSPENLEEFFTKSSFDIMSI